MDGIRLIVYPVRDIKKAKELYSSFLNSKPYVEGPYYVGFKTENVEIGLDPRGHEKGSGGPICYRDTKDIKKSVEELVRAGAKQLQPVTEVGGGLLIALANDLDGSIIGLRQMP